MLLNVKISILDINDFIISSFPIDFFEVIQNINIEKQWIFKTSVFRDDRYWYMLQHYIISSLKHYITF